MFLSDTGIEEWCQIRPASISKLPLVKLVNYLGSDTLANDAPASDTTASEAPASEAAAREAPASRECHFLRIPPGELSNLLTPLDELNE